MIETLHVGFYCFFFFRETAAGSRALLHQADMSSESCLKKERKLKKEKESFRSITGEFWLKAQSSKKGG